jgi:hypothetical protein
MAVDLLTLWHATCAAGRTPNSTRHSSKDWLLLDRGATRPPNVQLSAGKKCSCSPNTSAHFVACTRLTHQNHALSLEPCILTRIMHFGHELRIAQNLDPIPKAGAKRCCVLCVCVSSIDAAAAAAAAAAACTLMIRRRRSSDCCVASGRGGFVSGYE